MDSSLPQNNSVVKIDSYDELNKTADKVVAEDFSSLQILNQASAERSICKARKPIKFSKSMDNISQELISLKDHTKEDPDVYIRRAFGKNFKFSEEYLLSYIDPKVILKAIQKRYKFK